MGMAPTPPENTEQAERVRRKLQVARTLVIGSYVGLLVLFSVLALLQTDPNLPLWVVQVVPLLIFAPGLWRGRHRTYSWLCFVVLIYFTWAVTNTLSPLVYWRDYLVVLLTVVLFSSAMMASRWRQQWWLWENQP